MPEPLTMNKPATRLFQVQTHTRLARVDAIDATRTALASAGASVTDIRHYSNKSSVFQLLLPAQAWDELRHALTRASLCIDAIAPASSDELVQDSDGDVCGTLQLLYTGEDRESRDEIPAVPG